MGGPSQSLARVIGPEASILRLVVLVTALLV